MRISGLGQTESGDRIRVSARVEWEDSERPTREIWFETDQPFSKYIAANSNAFLLTAIVPAFVHGEQRLQIDGPICPWLGEGISTSLQILRDWYRSLAELPVIEPSGGFHVARPANHAQAASTMSGGIDSLVTLKRNRNYFPADHPLSIRTCFFVYGVDIGGYESLPGNTDHFDYTRRFLEPLMRHESVTLVPIYTNLRHLDDDDGLFGRQWFGAALAALGHVSSRQISTLFIPSGNSVNQQGPQGSHPLIDSNYSSSDVRVVHDGFGLSRLEKVGLVAEWPEALSTLRSCYAPFRGENVLNCGKCEKCLRTMTELLIHDRLADATTFPLDDLSVRDLDALLPSIPADKYTKIEEFLYNPAPILSMHSSDMWSDMLAPLKSIGRDDLANVVQHKLAEYRRCQEPISAPWNFRSVIGVLDRKLAGERLKKAYLWFQGKKSEVLSNKK